MRNIFSIVTEGHTTTLSTEGNTLLTALPLLGYLSSQMGFSTVEDVRKKLKTEPITLDEIWEHSPLPDSVTVYCEYVEEESATKFTLEGLDLSNSIKLAMIIFLTLEDNHIKQIMGLLSIYFNEDDEGGEESAIEVVTSLMQIAVALLHYYDGSEVVS